MASRNSMLEKILEDYPNCNSSSSSSVKNESRDLNDLFGCSSFLSPLHHTPRPAQSFGSTAAAQFSPFTGASSSSVGQSNARMNAHHLPNTSSFFNNDPFVSAGCSAATPAAHGSTMMNHLNLQVDNHKSQNPKNSSDDFGPLDELSVKGKFGWASCKGVQFPIILRRDDKLVPVRIVESKVSYGNLLVSKTFIL